MGTALLGRISRRPRRRTPSRWHRQDSSWHQRPAHVPQTYHGRLAHALRRPRHVPPRHHPPLRRLHPHPPPHPHSVSVSPQIRKIAPSRESHRALPRHPPPLLPLALLLQLQSHRSPPPPPLRRASIPVRHRPPLPLPKRPCQSTRIPQPRTLALLLARPALPISPPRKLAHD